jgi:hypothetical protein
VNKRGFSLVKIKGGNMAEKRKGPIVVVKVGQIPGGAIAEFAVENEEEGQAPTVADAFRDAGIELPNDDLDIRINTKLATLESVIADGDVILLVDEVGGN